MDLDEEIKHLDLHGPGSSAVDNVTNRQNKRDPVSQCFSNPVIMDCLLEYLDHSSTKMFSQSCQSILSIIRSNRAFLDKSIFYIGSGISSVLQSNSRLRNDGIVDVAFLQNVNFPWTSMRIEFNCLDILGIEIVTNLLSRVVRLELLKCASWRSSGEFSGPGLCRFLVAAEGLKELFIEEDYLDISEVDRTMFTSNSKLQTILEHLDVLHIAADRRCISYGRQPTFTLHTRDTMKALVCMPKHLRSFSFESERAGAAFVKPLLTFIKTHVNTLTALALHRWIWKTDRVLGLVCPNLKELSIIAQGEDLSRVCRFIMNHGQGQLLKLDVNLNSGTTLSPKPLVDTLILRGSQLITFSLAWKLEPRVASYHDPPGPSPDFSWLQKLSKLKNIEIRQFSSISGYRDSEERAPATHILANLPADVKTINITGAFPPRQYLALEQARHTQLMIENLGRFSDLTVLNLLQCPNALNDDILLFISSNLTHLRELGFSCCNGVTDLGFTGIGALKGLVKLKFYECDCLLNKGIREIMLSFSFPELKELHMHYGNYYRESSTDRGVQEIEADAHYIKKIISRNRMLEKLVLEPYESALENDLNQHFGRIIRVDQINGWDLETSVLTHEDKRRDWNNDDDGYDDYNYYEDNDDQ